MRHFSSHANALAERWMRVKRCADIYGICTHLHRQSNLAGMRADNASAEDFAGAVAVGCGRIIR